MLEINDLHAFYGKSHILHGVTLQVGKGEIVSLLGRNGVGRSTTLKAVMGQVHARGSILFNGQDLLDLKPHEIPHRGVGYVPEHRDVFPTLTVRQNLLLGEKRSGGKSRWSMEDTFDIFPRMRERADTPAGVMSGGEQQMLTLCRTLMGGPEFVMIDEPTEGLAPKIVQQVGNLLDEIAKRGIAILLVEQKLDIAMRISQRLYVMGHGKIVYEGTPDGLKQNEKVRKEWLEV